MELQYTPRRREVSGAVMCFITREGRAGDGDGDGGGDRRWRPMGDVQANSESLTDVEAC